MKKVGSCAIRRAGKRARHLAILLVVLGIMGGVAPAALADNGAEVFNYGTCVKLGVEPSSGLAGPHTGMVNSQGTKDVGPPSIPPPFDGSFACN
jgi:hypothetical protein